GEGHPDRLTAVLEGEDLLDAGQRGQGSGAVSPRLDHGACAGDRLRAEGAGVLGAEADDFAATDRGAGAAEAEGCEVVETARCVRGTRCALVRLGEGRAERGGAVLEDGDVVARGDLR